MIITIIGKGFVGNATSLLENESVTVWVYDIIPKFCSPIGLTYEQINEKSDLVFVCVPTPMNIDGSCNTGILKSVLSKLHHRFVVIRSTVPPGFSESQDCFFMPEFLTEKNWPQDFYHCPLWIFGKTSDEERNTLFQAKIKFLFESAFDGGKITSKDIYTVPTRDAEMIKLVRNNYLSTKVIFFNDIFRLCQTMGVNYSNVQHGVSADPRIGASHTQVDGVTFKGYGGTCFPKDTNSLFHIFQENNMESTLLEANLYTNEYILNSDKKWLNMYDRAIVNFEGRVLVYANINSSHKDLVLVDLEKEEKIIIIGITSEKDLVVHPRFHAQSYNLEQKFFIPRCDGVCCFIATHQPIATKMKTLLHLMEFTKTYSIPFEARFEDPMVDKYLYDWVVSQADVELG